MRFTISQAHLTRALSIICAIFFGCFILESCHPDTPSEKAVILSLQQMQELATTEYTLTKVVKASDDQTWYKIGDRKILITCEARIKAGIDFSKLDPRYVSRKGKYISIQMPEPGIISLNIPPEKIRVAYEETGFFRDRFSQQEQQNLLQQAELQIKKQSEQLDILKDAKANARQWLKGYLTTLGFEQIDLQFGKPFTSENQ